MISLASDDDPLDCPARYEGALIAGARFRYLAMKGDESAKIQVWMKLAEEGLHYAIGDDNNNPDHDMRFTPAHALPGARPLTSIEGVVLREDYW
jgi:hypothetical protein